jgi:hypothetical protein
MKSMKRFWSITREKHTRALILMMIEVLMCCCGSYPSSSPTLYRQVIMSMRYLRSGNRASLGC